MRFVHNGIEFLCKKKRGIIAFRIADHNKEDFFATGVASNFRIRTT